MQQAIEVWARETNAPEPCPTGFLAFDPNDPASIRAAQRALKQQLGLPYLPSLCNEPPPGLLSRLAGAVRALWPRPEPAPRRTPAPVLVRID